MRSYWRISQPLGVKRNWSKELKKCRIGVLVLTVLMSSSICAGTAQGFVQFKTVTFYENSHVGDLVSATETNNVATALTAFAALNPPFQIPGTHSLDGTPNPMEPALPM